MKGKTDRVIFAVLLGLIVGLPFALAPPLADSFGAPKIALFLAASFGLTAAGLAASAVSGRFVIPPVGFWPAAGFLGLVGLATLTSINPLLSVVGLRTRYFGLIFYLGLFLLFFTVCRLRWDRDRYRLLLKALAGMGAALGLICTLEALGLLKFASSADFGWRAYATLGNPIFAGALLALALPPTVYLISREEGPLKAVFAGAALAQVTGLLATGSVGAALAAVAGVAFYGLGSLTERRHKLLLPALAILAILILGGLGYYLKQDSGSMRLVAWRSALPAIAERPLTGHGPDTFRLTSVKFFNAEQAVATEVFEEAHNLWLTTAATAGLPAALLLAGLMGVCLAASRRRPTPERRALGAAIVVYLVATFINPEEITLTAFAWIVLAALAAEGKRRYVEINSFRPVYAAGSVILLLILPLLIRHLTAERLLFLAEREPDPIESSRLFAGAEAANPVYDVYPARWADRLISGPADARLLSIAEQAALRAVAKNPHEADNWVLAGNVYARRAETGPAYLRLSSRRYRAALKRNPYHLAAMRYLAENYYSEGKNAEARRWLDKYLAIEKDPEVGALRSRL